MRLRNILLLCCLLMSHLLMSQSTEELIKTGDSLYIHFKEEDALVKYKSALSENPSNMNLLVKVTEICLSIGGRQTDKNAKKRWNDDAVNFAHKAWNVDSNTVQACYLMATVTGRMSEVETDKKKMFSFIRDTKLYADRGLKINPDDGKINFAEGNWHYSMITFNWTKRVAVKTVYSGLPDANVDSCIYYFEKCRKHEIYYVYNFLLLAKSYKENNNPTKTTDILNKLLKLPTSCTDDKLYKEEARKMLEEQQ